MGLVVSEQRVEAAEAPVHGEVGGAALVLGDLCTNHKQIQRIFRLKYEKLFTESVNF